MSKQSSRRFIIQIPLESRGNKLLGPLTCKEAELWLKKNKFIPKGSGWGPHPSYHFIKCGMGYVGIDLNKLVSILELSQVQKFEVCDFEGKTISPRPKKKKS